MKPAHHWDQKWYNKIIALRNLRVCLKKTHTTVVNTPNWLNRTGVLGFFWGGGSRFFSSCGFLCLFCYCDKQYCQKQLRTGRGCFGLHLCCGPSLRQANLEAETEAETKEESYLQGCFCDSQVAFLYNSQPPAQEWHSPQWTEPNHLNHLSRKWPINWPTGQSDGGSPTVEVLLPRWLDSIPVKLTKTHQPSGLG